MQRNKSAPPAVFRTPDMPSAREIRWLIGVAVVFIIAVFWSFSSNPALDITVSQYFRFGGDRFDLDKDQMVRMVRTGLINATGLFYITALICGIIAWKKQQRVLQMAWHKWLFIGLTALAGPTLLTNVILKGNWGRARPREVVEFGGNLEFTQFWVWADQCRDNCSFISGEVSAMAMIFLSLALVAGRARVGYYLATIVFVLLSGYVRIAQGAHFLSDSLMALPLMTLTACAVYYVLYLWQRSPLAKIPPPDHRAKQ